MKETLHLRISLHQSHAHIGVRPRTRPCSKKYFVGDMCAPYRNKITPNQDRVGRVQCFSYGGGWRELRVSMEFETVAIATPCFLAKGCSWGSLFPLLFYPSSNAIGNLRAFSRANLFLTVIC